MPWMMPRTTRWSTRTILYRMMPFKTPTFKVQTAKRLKRQSPVSAYRKKLSLMKQKWNAKTIKSNVLTIALMSLLLTLIRLLSLKKEKRKKTSFHLKKPSPDRSKNLNSLKMSHRLSRKRVATTIRVHPFRLPMKKLCLKKMKTRKSRKKKSLKTRSIMPMHANWIFLLITASKIHA